MNNRDNAYDIVIVGGGPAGLAAAIYASRDRFRTLLLERGLIGGQIVNADQVDNYPGFPDGISGEEATGLMHRQATKYGLETVNADVTGIELNGEAKLVRTGSGDYTAGAVIIAGGTERQKLGVPGEEQYTGKGVSFCAICDAAFFGGKTVAVIGGGNAAITEAMHLTKFAARVIIIHRRDQLRATRVDQEKAFAEPRLEFRWDTVVTEIKGGDFVQGLRLRNVKTGAESDLPVEGVFISVGMRPYTDYLKDIVPRDEKGAILVNENMETQVPGIFAAGDIRHNSGLQMITAAGDGATAAMSAGKSLRK